MELNLLEIDPNIKVSDVVRYKSKLKREMERKQKGFRTIAEVLKGCSPESNRKRMSLVDRIVVASGIRASEQIEEDLNKKLIPMLKKVASGTLSITNLVYLLRDVSKCEIWYLKLANLKRLLDVYVYSMEDYLDRNTVNHNKCAVYNEVRNLLAELEPKGFYGNIKAEKDDLKRIPEVIELGASIVLNKSQSAKINNITFRTLNKYNPGAMKLMLRQIANRCEELLPNSRFQISLNETNKSLYNVECILNGKRYVTVV